MVMDAKQSKLAYQALLEVVERGGSQSQVARELNVAQSTVWKWLNEVRRIPAEYVLECERRYGTSRHLLRPDIYPRETLPREPMKDRPTADRFFGVDRALGQAS
jgi:DNA-binding transcriptional regulator YdaS (Cro superfamily)